MKQEVKRNLNFAIHEGIIKQTHVCSTITDDGLFLLSRFTSVLHTFNDELRK